jgi:DNA repair exonuclease SbcCD ATPase subunit
MEVVTSSLMLKRPITVKAIVTDRWKQEVQQQLQTQINQLDKQTQQLEAQGNNAIGEIQKQTKNPSSPQIVKQIENIQSQLNQKKGELLNKKNQLLQQLQQVQTLELNQEVIQAQMESFFRIEKGDNLVQKLNVEVVIRDGIVEDIRGEL